MGCENSLAKESGGSEQRVVEVFNCKPEFNLYSSLLALDSSRIDLTFTEVVKMKPH